VRAVDKELEKKELAPVNSLAAAGRVNLPLQHCVAAKDGGLADKRALMLVLNGCLKIDCKQTKTAVYSKLPSMIQNSEDFFEFIYYHRKVFDKRPYGMGSGMRRFISKWYLSQDPYDLALEVTRVRSRHKWSHADLIKLARVRTNDPAVAAVLKAVVRGLAAAKEEFKDKPEAQPILEYMSCVKEINTCNDPEAAVKLIEKHSFDIDSLPTHLLNHAKVWEHALSRLPVRGVLAHLKTMARRSYLSSENSQVLLKVLHCIKDDLAVAASKLQPAEILTVISKAQMGWEQPPTPAHRNNSNHQQMQPPHSSLIAGLHKMLLASMKNVPKVACSVIICVDCRPTITNGCWGLWSLKAVDAISLTTLSLMAGGADITLTTLGEDGGVQQVQLNRTDTTEILSNRLSRIHGGVIDPTVLARWAREGNKKADLVICLTDSHSEVNREELWTELEMYRNTVGPVKFVYGCLSSKNLATPVANKSDPEMMDICGWGPSSVRIIQAFAKNCF